MAPVHLISQYTPQAKLIIMMRNPVDRLYSMYQHQAYRASFGLVDKSFHTAGTEEFHALVLQQITVFEECVRKSSVRFCARDKYYYSSEEKKLDSYECWCLRDLLG
jgi:hypothetical protein